MNQKSREINYYSRLTTGLVVTCAVALVGYIYFLNTSVVHVVLQKETTQEIQLLRNEIALLESEYITAQHTIAARMATAEGFEAERSKVFVSRDNEPGLVLNQ